MDASIWVAIIGLGGMVLSWFLGRISKKRDKADDTEARLKALEVSAKEFKDKRFEARLANIESTVLNANLPALLKLSYLNAEEKLKAQAEKYIAEGEVWNDKLQDWQTLYQCWLSLTPEDADKSYMIMLHSRLNQVHIKFRSINMDNVPPKSKND